MLLILGSGPGAVHYVNLCGFSALETCNFVFVESLINRSLLRLLRPNCKIKYVGRPLHGACANLYGVLLSLLFICELQTILAWIKNGDTLLYNRGWIVNVFLNSMRLKFIIVPGKTAALVATSKMHISATCNFETSVIFSLNLRNYGTSTHTYILYMSRLNLLLTLDLAICNGLISAKPFILIYNLSLMTQAVVCASLRSFLFFSESLYLNAPSLLLVGNSVCSHVNVSWVKLGECASNIVY
ncbi:putative uroporphyrin-III c-methyltransferase [Candidatus Hodgkinia cicadicola]|nr:putative uroporphyrin-III c-methyltransferase [Candidatus Hodgkinia cicadicola]